MSTVIIKKPKKVFADKEYSQKETKIYGVYLKSVLEKLLLVNLKLLKQMVHAVQFSQVKLALEKFLTQHQSFLRFHHTLTMFKEKTFKQKLENYLLC